MTSLLKPALSSADSSQSAAEAFDLESVLTPQLDAQINARLAAAEQIKKQSSAAFPPSPAPEQPSGQISLQESLSSEAAAFRVSPAVSLLDSSLLGDRDSLILSAAATAANRIVGTADRDDITGTPQTDSIAGLQGSDTLRGADGNDVIKGGGGNDVISGDHVPAQTSISNDTISGSNGNDQLFGRIGRDKLSGGSGNDQLFGGSDGDRLSGGEGNDQLFGGIVDGDASFNPDPDRRDILFGGRGDDLLEGGVGNDYLNGSDDAAKGAGELDILTGGGGNDTFVLGSAESAYYIQGGVSQDFGLIVDWKQGDRVQLHGSASEYELFYDAAGNSTALGYLGGGGFELIGVFEATNLSANSLNSNTFQYV